MKRYSGFGCALYACKGVDSTSTLACNGKGTCDSLNNCTCSSLYSGSNCEDASALIGLVTPIAAISSVFFFICVFCIIFIAIILIIIIISNFINKIN
jgi:hypothetical protein